MIYSFFLNLHKKEKSTFIKLIADELPDGNALKKFGTFERWISFFYFPDIVEKKICGVFSKTLAKIEECELENCIKTNKKKGKFK